MSGATNINGPCVRSREDKLQIARDFLALARPVDSELVKSLRSAGFDFWRYVSDPGFLLELLKCMYVDLGLVDKLSIPLDALRHFLAAVFVDYNDNPYHNFNHCFCVTQMMFSLIWGFTDSWLTDFEKFILLTSAICHDLDHPGTNNAYQKKAQTWFTQKYHDSFLERHHADEAKQILSRPDCDILVGLSAEDQQRALALLKKLILATDMALHQQFVTQFKEVLASGYDFNNQEHRELVMLLMLKACDISNEARPLPVTELWVDCLLDEFFQQGDLERMEGLPVDAFMDRQKVERNSSQVGFIQFVSLPLFEELGQVVPLQTMLRNLQGNLQHYAEEKTKLSQGAPAADKA